MPKVVPNEGYWSEDSFTDIGSLTGKDNSQNPVEATGAYATPGPTKILRPAEKEVSKDLPKFRTQCSKAEFRLFPRKGSHGSEASCADVALKTNVTGKSLAKLNAEQENKLLRVNENRMLIKLDQEISEARAKVLSLGEKILQSTPFTVLITLVIFANAILEGVETQMKSGSDDPSEDSTWQAIGRAFLAIYTFELAARLCVYGLYKCVGDSWFVFDSIIVLSGLVEFFFEMFTDSDGQANLSQFRVLRLLRILKLMRMFRVLRFFKDLLLLVNSLATALRTTMWTWFLLMTITYVFSITFTKALGHEYPDNEELQKHFGTLFRSAFTLFGMTTLEWTETARLYLNDEPFLIVLTVIFIILTAFAILNVTVAVIVEHTLQKGMANADEKQERIEEELHKATAQIINIFHDSDKNGDGVMTKEEFQMAIANPQISRTLKELEVDFYDLEYLFDHLDLNRNGSISLNEFVQGTLQLRGPAKAKRLFELHCDVIREQSVTEKKLHEIKMKQITHEEALKRVVSKQSDHDQEFKLLASRQESLSLRQDSFSRSLETSLGQMTEALNSLAEEVRKGRATSDDKLVV